MLHAGRPRVSKEGSAEERREREREREESTEGASFSPGFDITKEIGAVCPSVGRVCVCLDDFMCSFFLDSSERARPPLPHNADIDVLRRQIDRPFAQSASEWLAARSLVELIL